MPPPTKPPTSRPKQRQRDALQVRLAALLTAHPPARTMELVPDPALNIHSQLEFEPVGAARPAAPAAEAPDQGRAAVAAPAGAVFGLLRSGYLPRTLAFGRLPVKRGRWGTKPAEELQLLQPFPPELLALPALRWRGLLKAMAEALDDVRAAVASPAPSAKPAAPAKPAGKAAGTGSKAKASAGKAGTPAPVPQPPPPPAITTTELWLATELALQGFLPLAGVRKFAAEHENPLPRHGKAASGGGPPALIERDGLLFWRGWIVRQIERLVATLGHAKRRNPLRRELSVTQVQRLLELPSNAAAEAILYELAQAYKLAPVPKAWQVTYLLSGPLAAPLLSAPDTATARDILALYRTAEPGPSLTLLRTNHPGRLHVVAWLLEAERLIEMPGGSLVTQERFSPWLRAMPLQPGQLAPGVREFKERLGLGRREAEALRAWYVQQGMK